MPIYNITSAESSFKQTALAGNLVKHSVRAKIQKEITRVRFEARNETLEDLGFSLDDILKSKENAENKTKSQLSASLFRIANALPEDENTEEIFSQLETALATFEEPRDLMYSLLQIFHDTAMVALIMQAYLQRRKKYRKRLETLLDSLLDEMGNDTSVMLFGVLFFGAKNKAIRQQINHLYQETSREFAGIVSFYRKLKQSVHRRDDRRKTVVCLLHSFSEDIHDVSDGLFKIKISYVIYELKRLSTLLSMDTACEEIAHFMEHLPHDTMLSADMIMDAIVEWLDTAWIYIEMLNIKMMEFSLRDLPIRIIFLQKMIELFKTLPNNCFEDRESRNHIIATLQQSINEMSVEEMT